MKKRAVLIFVACLSFCMVSPAVAELTAEQNLGKFLYFDTYLSLNKNQSCASCHHPSAKFADPLNVKYPYDFPVSLGSDTTLNGGRNAPTASYAAFIPIFHWNEIEGLYIGGQFWDGRADTLKDQAKGPFLNPVEMAMLDEAAVIAAIADPRNKRSKIYRKYFKLVYGIDIKNIDTSSNNTDVLNAYDKTAEAIAKFEQTVRFSPFTSKYDYYLVGKAELTDQEARGLMIFEAENMGNCAACHPNRPTSLENGKIVPPLFTDFSFDNLGVPKSTNHLIDDNPIDYGLGERFAGENGKFRVSSLRNIKRTAPYGHNGYFPTLADIVHFYNTAGVPEEGWPEPEVAENVNREELGNLGLTLQQEDDLVAFLKTLTDGYAEKMPDNFVLPSITPLN